MDESTILEEETQTDTSSEIFDDYDDEELLSPAPSSENQSKVNQPKEDQSKKDQPKEDQPKEDQSKEDQSKEDQSKEDQPKEDQSKEEESLDILGNGQLKKKVRKKGQKDVKPQRGDICTLEMIGMLDDGTVVEYNDNMSIQVGDLEVVQGLDLTIVLMELGEVAEIRVDPRFAYGTRGDGSVPPNATVTYMVELKAITDEPEIETLSIRERREIGNKKRLRGNWWFIRKDFTFSIQCYRRALDYLEIKNSTKWNKNEAETVTDTELQILLDDSLKVHNNFAAALIEMKNYHGALDHVETVLKFQPKNTKALFRKGKIFKIENEYGKAYATFLEVQKLDPNLKSVQAELMSLKEKISKQSKQEKNLYAKMLGIGTEKDAKHPSKNTKVKNNSKIAKGILWTLLGASAAVVGILIHRFAS
ncbi:PREDICTED: peptidyl-prolyl cis-trans isomerase FKBP8-like isoform X2 [Wasmannia auropunctata]|nr:PREDICTED: peptidyl-prolyl cis-trans isomerase FKBP8-like isoform X2 [Wasmannia auropunctata]